MQSTINERLKILFETLGVKSAQMARTLGISPSTLHNYTDPERESKPGYEVLEKLYSSFEDINLHWLFGGGGEPLLSMTAEQRVEYRTQKKNVGNTIGTNNGTAQMHYSTVADCEKDLRTAQMEIALLHSQLADRERLIESKQEIIDLLKQAKS
jgi:transcriptional regulator with XRE-family HTH domain